MDGDRMDSKEFSQRLSKLRAAKGVSARDMSLSLGQNENYIRLIEAGKSLPSMQAFFNICEYLKLTPEEFFETGNVNPVHMNTLIRELKHLDARQLELIEALVAELNRK